MYTSFFRSPCKKAFFTSSWWTSQSRFAAQDSNILMVFILATKEKVSSSPHRKYEDTFWPPVGLYTNLPSFLGYVSRYKPICIQQHAYQLAGKHAPTSHSSSRHAFLRALLPS